MENTQQAEQFLTAIQSFTDQGRYIEAAERLQSTEARTALSTKRLALELAEVFGQQGYYGKAVRTLEQHVTDPEVMSLHNIVGMRLQMVLLSFKAQRLHDFKGLGGIRQRVLSLKDIISSLILCDNYLDEDVVRTVEGYCQLMQWISEFNRPLPKEAMERVFVWVKRALDANISHSQFRLAVILLRAYTAGATSRLAKLYGLDMDECKEAMQRLADAPAIPNLLKAKVFHLLAWTTDPEDKALGETYEVKAVELYKESCSTTGEVGIRVSRVCHDMSSGNMDLVEGGNILEGLLQQLEDQDYLAGRFKALEIMQAKLTGREFFELQLSLIDTAQTLAEQAEAPVLAMIFKLRAISHWYIRGGHTPRVIEFGKGLYDALDEVDCAWFKGAVANIVALAYIPLNDHQNAVEWSKHSEHLWMSCSVADGAGAVETQLLADVQACSTWTEQEFDAAVAKWTTVIDHEAEKGLTEDVVKKMGHLTDALMKRRDPRTNHLLERWEKLLSQQPPTPSAKAIDFKLAASCLGTVKSLLSPSSQGSWSPQLVAQCINLAQKARRLYQKHKNITEDAKALSAQATLMFYASQRYSSEDLLRASIETMDTTVEAFRLLDSKAMVSSATYWRAVFAFHQNDSAEAVMKYLLEAETARNDERVDVAMLGRLDGLTQKQRMTADPSNLKIFEMAFQLCRREGWVEQLWEWLQKSKARSLSDLLGLRALIPGYLRAEIMADPEANRLFVQEEALLQAIAQSQAAERLPLRNQLHLLQQQWRQYSVLDSVTAIRNATPASLEQLRSWFARTPELQDLGPLVFADWLFIEDDIFLLTVRPDSVAPQLAKCPISRTEINKWALRFAKGQGDDDEEYDYDFTREEWDDDDPDYALRHLDALILPLGQVSAPEDLIVLSTTGILHSIPLHALWIDEEPLITRNPVVYAANMTSFMQCFGRSVNFPPQAESTPMTIMAVYEPGGGRVFSPAEQSAVYSAASNLGSITGARVFSDQAANKQHFSNALETSTIFHFHGHCVLRPELLTDQALVLAQGEEVSVSDIFGLTLDTASHVTLVACESAVQGVAKADEPLGLVTALLCAGAGSVLGTLWPIASMPGRLFAELFYADVLRQIQEGAGRYGVVDLAKTLRKVVLDLRTDKRTRKPYYWAPFVLHGSPVLRQPSS